MSAEPPTIVGIDLGTTFSLAAILRAGAPVLIPNAIGEVLTPSAVSVTDDGTLLVGAPARARATTHPLQTALEFKRDMGTDRVYHLGGRTFSAPDLSALVLGALKRDAEEALGVAVEEAVVTVPAYFGDAQRQATRDAGAIAGLKVERIINEPTAAALAFGLHERGSEMRVVVLDLGGGTFDVTVLEIVEGIIEIHASAGDARLGGTDFDEALARVAAERCRSEHGIDFEGQPVAWARLREACEQAKKRLSTQDEAAIVLPQLRVGTRTLDVEMRIARGEAEAAWADLLQRIRVPIRRALADASMKPQAIDQVLLVGGSSRIPSVSRLAASLFGRLPLRSLPADEAVALGAAVQAGLKSGDRAVADIVVTDVAPFTLGIAVIQTAGATTVSGVFAPIIERGTTIPVSRVQRFSTSKPFQTHILIEVFQGEHSLCRDNRKLGEYDISGLRPIAGSHDVDVRFTYDQNGILEVEMTVVETQYRQVLVIERSPGRLTAAQVAAAREAMVRLKLHPRDALPNVTALTRADALYAELSGPARHRLGEGIAVFRAALDAQDPKIIHPLRESLVSLTAELRRGSIQD